MECVYLLQEIDFDGTPTGLYKIGKTTKEAEQRKRQYQAGNARRVDLHTTIKVTNSQAVETELHRLFADYRMSYGGGDEWFDFRSVDINKVVTVFKRYDESVPEPQPQPYNYYYREPSHTELPPLIPVAVVVGIVFFLAGMFGSAGINSKLKEHYRQAYLPLEGYASRSGSGQYNTAAINFRRLASNTNNNCLKTYGENMEKAALEADRVLRQTKKHSQAWDVFRGLQQKAWNSAQPCQQDIQKLGAKN
ncbi:MAG: GIY-YIG nuclease family protein [Potamolinea sp.]